MQLQIHLVACPREPSQRGGLLTTAAAPLSYRVLVLSRRRRRADPGGFRRRRRLERPRLAPGAVRASRETVDVRSARLARLPARRSSLLLLARAEHCAAARSTTPKISRNFLGLMDNPGLVC